MNGLRSVGVSIGVSIGVSLGLRIDPLQQHLPAHP